MGIFQKAKKENFSGCYKINSKNGGIQIIETNAVEIPLSPVNSYVIKSIIESIKNKNYTGTLIFKFEQGQILEYAYTRYLEDVVALDLNNADL